MKKQVDDMVPVLSGSSAEMEFVRRATAEGWTVTRRGYPDFICYKRANGNGGAEKIMLVEVKKKGRHRLKSSKWKFMNTLANYGVHCYRWSPDKDWFRGTNGKASGGNGGDKDISSSMRERYSELPASYETGKSVSLSYFLPGPDEKSGGDARTYKKPRRRGTLELTAEEESMVLFLYVNGVSMSRISDTFGLYPNCVARVLDYHGVERNAAYWWGMKFGVRLGKCL